MVFVFAEFMQGKWSFLCGFFEYFGNILVQITVLHYIVETGHYICKSNSTVTSGLHSGRALGRNRRERGLGHRRRKWSIRHGPRGSKGRGMRAIPRGKFKIITIKYIIIDLLELKKSAQILNIAPTANTSTLGCARTLSCVVLWGVLGSAN